MTLPESTVVGGGVRCFDSAHRSYSTDRTWDECQFLAHAVATKQAKPTYGHQAVVGSVVDDMVKAALWGTDAVGVEAAITTYAKQYGAKFNDELLDRSITKAERLYALWEREVRPAWEQVGVYACEWELHFDIDGVPYHVHIDVALADGTVVDLKTSEKRLDRTGSGRADADVQLTTYDYAVWAVFGHEPPAVILDGLIYANPPDDVRAWNPSAEKPWWDRQPSKRTPEQRAAFADDVRRREAGRRFAAATGTYQTQGRASQFACNGCPAKPICPSWRGFVDVVTAAA